MAHKQKKDPFVPIAFLIGAAVLGAAVFVLVSNLLNTISNNSIKGAEDHTRQEAVADESLKPVGSVTTTADVAKNGGAAPAPAAGGSVNGEDVYKATCFACHGAGVAGAPILGNKEHWKPRAATGLDALMGSALNGKGAMPAKGGNPALSDAEIKAAILYMTKQAGFDLGGGDAPAAAPAPAKKEAPAEKTASEEPAKEAPAPKEEAPATEPTAPTKPEPVVEPKKPETPAAPEAPAPKEEAPAEKPAETTPAAPAETTPPAAPAEKPAEAAPAPAASTANGEAIYNATCFACHKTGVAGAPLFGNKELWAPRIATGMDALVHSALNGKGAMPPKGGNTALSDDEVKAAVAYMVNSAK